ncbi:disease resistance protein RPV1 [Eucalyptus grandis]|uniref:disease resistance protein RPV1 n=1 Tax=Eucalyptus grandis TaxID=71139 RepID=UPI00192E7C8F|nr:disease resistance protein RPV1 [Eucalyptus grandis]
MWGVFLNLFYCLCRLCSSNSLDMERNESTHLEDPNPGAFSSSSSPLIGDYEGGTKKMEGKDYEPTHSEDPNPGAFSSSSSPLVDDYEGGTKKMEAKDYEVFLSFRGKDTRKGFTDHLYNGLVAAGIHVFRDNNELRFGEEIGPELLNSITQSKISIAIISENYASSKWCLRELTHMLKCKRSEGQIVLPIFYKVEPSQVRLPTGRFRDAINAKRKNLANMDVKEWEEALEEVHHLKGWESEKFDNGHEAALVKAVVKRVMMDLRTFQPILHEQFVGIDERVEDIMSLIDPEFKDTRIIGIYGMGGIGKTTLARVLYNNLSIQFEHHSFMANVRETSMHKGIECLQKQLIYNILRSPYDVPSVYEGKSVIRSRFICKKVLIILDDINDNTQLNALAGDRSWFKAGSIVIITTRNKRILDEARADHMYQLNELPLDKSLILFNRHAFRKNSPQRDYQVISREVVYTTGGLPLALEIIGSYLYGRSEKIWKDTLEKLKKVPDAKVQGTLQISYDALEYEEKQIFLDIACFFIESSKKNPTYMWDDCGFFPEKGIEVLSLMSLIKIDKDGNLMMHDQLRDFGREIVRKENIKEPQNRSRLWNSEEAADVIDNNKVATKLKVLNLMGCAREQLQTCAFRSLEILILEDCEDLEKIHPSINDINTLISLNVNGCSKLKELPLGVSRMEELRELLLNETMIREIPIAVGNLTKLETLKVACCEQLAQLPKYLGSLVSLTQLHLTFTEIEELPESIGSLKKLKTLVASHCHSLAYIPSSIGHMASLSLLDLTRCVKLAQLPDTIGSLTSLQSLLLSECHSLREMPDSIGKLESLTELHLKSTAFEELPEFIGSLKKLETLDASYCASLARIPSSIGHLASLSLLDLRGCNKLAQLPDTIGSLTSLGTLSLSKCHSLRETSDSIGKLESLINLGLQSTAFEKLPNFIGSSKKLKTLDASYCASLVCIPNTIGHLASLTHLDLTWCTKLAQLPDTIGSLTSLQRLSLLECHSLREMPNSIEKLGSLTDLCLKSTGFDELPKFIGSLKNLKNLDACYCASLARIPSSIGHLASLSRLDLRGCDKLAQLPDTIGSLTSLQRLLLSECHSLREIPDSIGNSLNKLKTLDASYCASLARIPSSIGHLASLSLLDLRGCDKLAQLPDTIGSLTSLQKLDLRGCDKLAQLPDTIGSLTSLKRLLLSECRSLKEMPDSIGKLESLIELHLKSTAFEELPEFIARIPSSICHLASLSCLYLRGCSKLAKLPDNIGSLTSLEHLFLQDCHTLREMPDSIGKLESLIGLGLKSTAFEELPEFIGSLKKLKFLEASYCASLARIPSSISHLSSRIALT